MKITRNVASKVIQSLCILAPLAILSGCGDDDSGSAPSANTNEPSQAVLKSVSLSSVLTKTDIDGIAAQAGLTQLAGLAKCDVKIYSLEFYTQGVEGEQAKESGALMTPVGSGCDESIPLMANGHGTRTLETYTNTLTGNSFVDIAIYAAQGYAVVAPNYLGLGGSDYSFHPYLHAETEALSMVNAIRATQESAEKLSLDLSGKVMLKGYSQGGHTAMSAQRKIEVDYANQIDLVASSPMAGPYLLEETLLRGLDPEIENIGAGVLLAYMVNSYQNTYGNLYESINEVFKADYTNAVESYFPGDLGVFDLILGPFFPSDVNAFLNEDYVIDFKANSENGLRVAARKNEVLTDFVPATPTALCGSSLDGTVPFFNTTEAAEIFYDRGVEVMVIDVAPYVTVDTGEDSGLTHHLKGNALCNAFVRDQFFDNFK